MFGTALQDWQVPLPAAIAFALAVGVAGGALNAAVIARFRVPPLIVTLGTMALFRGIAEGITEGARNFSGFPASFLAIGQGYLGGVVPAQLPILVAAAARLRAAAASIRRSAEPGMPSASAKRERATPACRSRVAWRWRMCWLAPPPGLRRSSTPRTSDRRDPTPAPATSLRRSPRWSSAARRSPAAAERSAARSSDWPSWRVLTNGLQLAALPSELAGVLTGVVLVAAIALDPARRPATGRRGNVSTSGRGDTREKQSGRDSLCGDPRPARFSWPARTSGWFDRSCRPRRGGIAQPGADGPAARSSR